MVRDSTHSFLYPLSYPFNASCNTLSLRSGRNGLVRELAPAVRISWLYLASWLSNRRLTGAHSPTFPELHPPTGNEDMLRKRNRTTYGTSGSNLSQSQCEWNQNSLHEVSA